MGHLPTQKKSGQITSTFPPDSTDGQAVQASSSIEWYFRTALAASLFVVAIVRTVGALYAGREVALPLALAIMLKLLFQPVVDAVCSRLRLRT